MIDKNTKIVSVYYGNIIPSELINKKYPLLYSFNSETKLIGISKLLDIKEETNEFIYNTISLDSKLIINCSMDHLFYSFRGKLVEAINLKIGQAVKAFSMSLHPKDGHYRVHGFINNKPKHQYVARMIYEYFNGPIQEGLILHHKDFNKVNNLPDNFELLTNSTHSWVHYPRNKFFRRNHKVIDIKFPKKEITFISLILDKNNSIVIADPLPVAGCSSGIIIEN